MFEPRQNILSNVSTNVRKHVVTWVERSRESDRRYPDYFQRSLVSDLTSKWPACILYVYFKNGKRRGEWKDLKKRRKAIWMLRKKKNPYTSLKKNSWEIDIFRKPTKYREKLYIYHKSQYVGNKNHPKYVWSGKTFAKKCRNRAYRKKKKRNFVASKRVESFWEKTTWVGSSKTKRCQLTAPVVDVVYFGLTQLSATCGQPLKTNVGGRSSPSVTVIVNVVVLDWAGVPWS